MLIISNGKSSSCECPVKWHIIKRELTETLITCKSIGTAAIVVRHAVDADGPVLARRGPALIPVRLALAACVPVDAVTRISAVLTIDIHVVTLILVRPRKQKFIQPFIYWSIQVDDQIAFPMGRAAAAVSKWK